MIKLYADCKTDTERASFFKSGRGWESGVVAKSLEGDLADVFAFRATVAAALAELRTEMIKLSKTVEGNLEDDPSCDEEHDYNARCRGMIKGISECAVKFDATIAALDLTADVFDAAIASRPDVLEKLADEAVKEKQ